MEIGKAYYIGMEATGMNKKRKPALMIEMEQDMLDRLRSVANEGGQTLKGMITILLRRHLEKAEKA